MTLDSVANANRTEPAEPSPPAVFTAIRAVMAEVRGVAKTGEMKDGRGRLQYHFQRFEDMADRVGDAFRTHGLFPQSTVLDTRVETWDKSADGRTTKWVRVILTKRFTFVSLIDGSSLSVEAVGEGSDSSDKATNKAETSALKNALRHALLLSTREDGDPDAERPSDEGPTEVVRNARPEQPAQTAPAEAPEQRAARALTYARANIKTRAELSTLWQNLAQADLLNCVPEGSDIQLGALLRAMGGTLPEGS